ncbi:hypothetical protein SCOCK_200054 [Actinacidiphila cocklensis]|uniref:Uncharacterized protein n=1 Tax=Actinacidiphila cocklensis TaxID=887465 RepID=A0A9W4DPR1_9ACTN|nr:hypothetical protein SCOCK_200054 [Actinacidiphila cocklensis]
MSPSAPLASQRWSEGSIDRAVPRALPSRYRRWSKSRTCAPRTTLDGVRSPARGTFAGLQGHRSAIDVTVAETALRQTAPVAILTSDVDDTGERPPLGEAGHGTRTCSLPWWR